MKTLLYLCILAVNLGFTAFIFLSRYQKIQRAAALLVPASVCLLLGIYFFGYPTILHHSALGNYGLSLLAALRGPVAFLVLELACFMVLWLIHGRTIKSTVPTPTKIPFLIPALVLMVYIVAVTLSAAVVIYVDQSRVGTVLPFSLTHWAIVPHTLSASMAKAGTLFAGLCLLLPNAHKPQAVLWHTMFWWSVCLLTGMLWAGDSNAWGSLWQYDGIERLSLANALFIAIALLLPKDETVGKPLLLRAPLWGSLMIISLFLHSLILRGGLLWGMHQYGSNKQAFVLWCAALALSFILLFIMNFQKSVKRELTPPSTFYGAHLLPISVATLWLGLLYVGLFTERLAQIISPTLLNTAGILFLFSLFPLLWVERKQTPMGLTALRICILCVSLLSLYFTTQKHPPKDPMVMALAEDHDTAEFPLLEGMEILGHGELTRWKAHISWTSEKKTDLLFYTGAGNFFYAPPKTLLEGTHHIKLQPLAYRSWEGLTVQQSVEPWRSVFWLSVMSLIVTVFFPCLGILGGRKTRKKKGAY